MLFKPPQQAGWSQAAIRIMIAVAVLVAEVSALMSSSSSSSSSPKYALYSNSSSSPKTSSLLFFSPLPSTTSPDTASTNSPLPLDLNQAVLSSSSSYKSLTSSTLRSSSWYTKASTPNSISSATSISSTSQKSPLSIHSDHSVSNPSSKSISSTHKKHSSVPYNITSTKTHHNTTKSRSVPSSITSCAAPNIGDFINERFLSLSSEAFISVLVAEIAKLQEWQRTLARIAAATSYKNTARVNSYYSSLYGALESDITSFYGTAGNAWLDFGGITDGCLFTTCLNQYYKASSSFRKHYPNAPATLFDMYFYADPPCCGQCTLVAQNVEILYFPTPPPTPPVTALFDSSLNVTYESPSVYAFFTTLSAYDMCGPVGDYWYKWKGYKFPPGALSTSSYAVNPNYDPSIALTNWPGQWTAINFADFQDSKCKCTTNCEYDPILEVYLTDICTPQLSIPAIVSQLDPLWPYCASDFGGVFDPPIALSQGPGLTLPKTTPNPPPQAVTTTPGPIPPPQTSPIPTPPGPPVTTPLPPANPPETTAPEAPATIGFGPPPSSISVIPTPFQAFQAPPPETTVSGIVLTALPGSSVFLVGTQAVSPGSSITLSNGAIVSISPAGIPVVILGAASTTPVAAGANVLTLSGQTLTGNPSSALIVAGQTLVPGGPPITVSGTVISLGPGGTVIVVGGTTITSVGSIIASVTSGASRVTTSTLTSTPVQYTGGVGKVIEARMNAVFVVVLIVLYV